MNIQDFPVQVMQAMQKQVMKTVTVDTFGVEYPEPEKLAGR